MNIYNKKIAIIGLGYVGLPLAIEFAKKYNVKAFDINTERINELTKGIDRTLESDLSVLTNSNNLFFTSNLKDLINCDIFIVTVPTPINQFKSPDLTPLLNATAMISTILKKGDIVIYESTVYPGCTEEDCVPVLEKLSKLKYNVDFFCGYSPERINPGDKINTLTKIKKVTSGSTPVVSKLVDDLYKSIIIAGTHNVSSIKIAEASKAVENAQRDINISFVNELALIFDRMNIDTSDVINAAATKWNFHKYMPGLVGGHCIGIDPYYLAHKAEMLGYHPQVILSGRRVNDNMGMFVANKIVKLMIRNGISIKGSKILVLGLTFKENCPDIRNSKVVDVVNELLQFGLIVEVHDPYADKNEVLSAYNILLIDNFSKYDAIVLTVSHDLYSKININEMKKNISSVIFDTKSFLDRSLVDGRL
jgi:UDP-N-acetyl-D-galactosamine dehydrogenase